MSRHAQFFIRKNLKNNCPKLSVTGPAGSTKKPQLDIEKYPIGRNTMFGWHLQLVHKICKVDEDDRPLVHPGSCRCS